MNSTMRISSSTNLATAIRLDVLEMVSQANASHIGSCYSMVDILAVLYSRILNVDTADPNYAAEIGSFLVKVMPQQLSMLV